MNVTLSASQNYYSKDETKLSVNPKESYLIFWKLKKNYWKQILDGNMHRYDKWVFDEGKHGGPIEEGYLGGVHQSCHYASTREIN